jgi:hypothetical protein
VTPEIDDPDSPEDYLGWAVSLWSGAQQINPNARPGLIIPFYLLIGFALECALKAFLLHSGIAKAKLRSPRLRHDLNMLFALAIERGLKPGSREREIIDATSEPHREFRFRYPGESSEVLLHKREYALAATEALLENVRKSAGILPV